MRIAIISDVHSNLEALQSVLEAIDKIAADEILCCGDIVGYMANPNECIALLKQRGILAVAGNHDLAAIGRKSVGAFWDIALHAILWTREQLSPESCNYLSKLPVFLSAHGSVLFHGALHPESEPEDFYLRKIEDARLTIAKLNGHCFGSRLGFFGHTHEAGGFELFGNRLAQIGPQPIILRSDASYLINPGTVGVDRLRPNEATFVIYDSCSRQIEFHRVGYDYNASLAKARRAGIANPQPLLRKFRRVRNKAYKYFFGRPFGDFGISITGRDV